MHQIWSRLELRPKPRWGSSQRSPRPYSWILGGPTSKVREVRRKEKQNKEKKEKRRKEERKWRKKETRPLRIKISGFATVIEHCKHSSEVIINRLKCYIYTVADGDSRGCRHCLYNFILCRLTWSLWSKCHSQQIYGVVWLAERAPVLSGNLLLIDHYKFDSLV